MSDYFDLILRRESCRKYDAEKPVEREKLVRCAEAARLAPSACNSQPWRYLIVTNEALVNALRPCVQSMGMNKFASEVKTFVVVLEEKASLSETVAQRFKDQAFSSIDIGLSVSQFCCAASEQGLSTCILGWLNEKKIREVLDLPRTARVRLVLCVGYATEGQPRPKKRKPVEETVQFYE